MYHVWIHFPAATVGLTLYFQSKLNCQCMCKSLIALPYSCWWNLHVLYLILYFRNQCLVLPCIFKVPLTVNVWVMYQIHGIWPSKTPLTVNVWVIGQKHGSIHITNTCMYYIWIYIFETSVSPAMYFQSTFNCQCISNVSKAWDLAFKNTSYCKCMSNFPNAWISSY
jgi:hypothetical protein